MLSFMEVLLYDQQHNSDCIESGDLRKMEFIPSSNADSTSNKESASLYLPSSTAVA